MPLQRCSQLHDVDSCSARLPLLLADLLRRRLAFLRRRSPRLNRPPQRIHQVHEGRRRAAVGPPSSPTSLPLRLSGGWFARRHPIHPIDFAEFIQKLWIAIVQTDDLAKLGAVAPFVLYDFAPNFDPPKQQWSIADIK